MKNDPNASYVTEHQLTVILDKRFDAFEEKMDQKFQKLSDDILEVIRDFSERVDERFNRLEAKVDRLETKVGAMGAANQARDAQITRHEHWHYRIANKLDINLSPEV